MGLAFVDAVEAGALPGIAFVAWRTPGKGRQRRPQHIGKEDAPLLAGTTVATGGAKGLSHGRKGAGSGAAAKRAAGGESRE